MQSSNSRFELWKDTLTIKITPIPDESRGTTSIRAGPFSFLKAKAWLLAQPPAGASGRNQRLDDVRVPLDDVTEMMPPQVDAQFPTAIQGRS